MRTVVSEIDLGGYRMLLLSDDGGFIPNFGSCRIDGKKYKVERISQTSRTITVKSAKPLLGGSVDFDY